MWIKTSVLTVLKKVLNYLVQEDCIVVFGEMHMFGEFIILRSQGQPPLWTHAHMNEEQAHST